MRSSTDFSPYHDSLDVNNNTLVEGLAQLKHRREKARHLSHLHATQNRDLQVEKARVDKLHSRLEGECAELQGNINKSDSLLTEAWGAYNRVVQNAETVLHRIRHADAHIQHTYRVDKSTLARETKEGDEFIRILDTCAAMREQSIYNKKYENLNNNMSQSPARLGHSTGLAPPANTLHHAFSFSKAETVFPRTLSQPPLGGPNSPPESPLPSQPNNMDQGVSLGTSLPQQSSPAHQESSRVIPALSPSGVVITPTSGGGAIATQTS